VTYENYALAAVQIGDTASEEIWEYSNANGSSLLRGLQFRGRPLSYDFLGAKLTVIRGVRFWVIPAGPNNGFAAFGVYKVDASRNLHLLAVLPQSDSASRYGYGSNLIGDHLTIERPYDQPGKKCCKYDKYYEYIISVRDVTLKRVHYELELP
jgi:hypothetical protein